MKQNQIKAILILFVIIIIIQAVAIIMLVTKTSTTETRLTTTTITKTTTITITEAITITITETTQTPTQYLQIIDSTLIRSLKPYQVNETYITFWVSVEVVVTIRNIGDRVVTLTDIKIDGVYSVHGFTRVNINPRQTFTGSYPVIIDPEVGETKALYEKVGAYWELGTEHVVTIYYQVTGTDDIQTISQKVLVT